MRTRMRGAVGAGGEKPPATRLCFISTNPVVRLPVLVGHRNDKNIVFFQGLHQFIRKLVHEALSYFTPLCGPRFGILRNS